MSFQNLTAYNTIPLPISDMSANGANGFGHPNETTASIEVDALVIGAGFSGITAIHRLRKAGLTVKCMEASGDFGGVWNFHRYKSYTQGENRPC